MRCALRRGLSHQAVLKVTGAESYIGAAVIERLLVAGHTVHATWRGKDASTIKHLRGMKNAITNLRLFVVGSPLDILVQDCSLQKATSRTDLSHTTCWGSSHERLRTIHRLYLTNLMRHCAFQLFLQMVYGSKLIPIAGRSNGSWIIQGANARIQVCFVNGLWYMSARFGPTKDTIYHTLLCLQYVIMF